MTTNAITRALEVADKKLANVTRKEMHRVAKEANVYAGAAAVLGAIAAGALDAKYPDKKVGPVKTVAAVSGLATAAGLFTNYLGAWGLYTGMIGIGGICYFAGAAANKHYANPNP